MSKAGKFLGLISPVLAIGVVALMLFVPTYGYESGGCRADYVHQPSNPECNHESGTISAFRVALEEGDSTLFRWSGFVVILSLIAAASALVGRAAPVWVCAMILWVLAVLGMVSLIGLFIVPLAVVLFASATLLTVARYESRTC
jgi:hypothetical protein